MLSFENPPSDLNTNSDDHNKFDDENTHLPNFSIRDYVFNARRKDIKTNWPFSKKNLQLCMKHGVKDLLPPLQAIDSVKIRKSYPVISTVLPENFENNCSYSDKVPSSSHNATLTSKRTSNSQAGSKSGPTIRTAKIEKNTQSSSKKCKVTVKFNTIFNPSSRTEDLAETMTSIICPVCKTFSSSSNTTLNAHIDQCLSVEPTCIWTDQDSTKITSSSKYRIKPRKMRSMVDIMAAAPHCTLEELDLRNGSNWAIGSGTGSTFTKQITDRAYSKRSSQDLIENNGDKSEVYFDSNGTKVRILSKFNNGSSVARLEENTRKNESIKEGGIMENVLPINEKKHRIVKHQKFININKNVITLSPKACSSSQIHENKDEDYRMGGDRYKEKHLTQKLGAQVTIKPNDLKSLRPRIFEKYMTQSSVPQAKIKSCDSGVSKPRIFEKHLTEDLEAREKINKSSDSETLRKQVFSNRTCLSKKIKKQDFVLETKINSKKKNNLNFKKSKVRHTKEIDEGYENEIGKKNVEKGSHMDNILVDREITRSLEKDNEFSRENNDIEHFYQEHERSDSSSSSDTRSDNILQSAEEYKVHLYEAESPIYLGDKISMFCSDRTDEGINGQKDYMGPAFDPIPIPGPPGSFLPSPRDMGFEDLINSSQDPYNKVDDRISLDSPISATSTVSNLNCSEDFVKAIAFHEKEKFQYNFSGNPVPEIIAGVFPPATNTSKFKDDDNQTCCCSQKERFSSDISLKNHRNTTTVKIPDSFDSASPSPSVSTPILRLMGKNLMVVNIDEDSTHRKDLQPCSSPKDRTIPHFLNFSKSSLGNTQNQHKNYNFPQDPMNMMMNQSFYNTANKNNNQYLDGRFFDTYTDFGSRNGNSYAGPPQMAYFHVPNSNPVFWTSQTRPFDRSAELQHGTSMAPSVSANQLRPGLYFSPNFS